MANNWDFEVYKIGDVIPDFLVSSVGAFSCGNEELDRFLKERACLYCRESLAATFLFLAERDGARAAAGYVSICNGSVSRKIFHNVHCNSNPVSNRRFQRTVLALIDESKYMQEYPATKIARLAIDESFQRSGLGSVIVAYVRRIALENECASRFITVDAKTETGAYKFYRKLGFEYFVEAHEKEDFGDREAVPMYLDLLRESIQ